jgi:4-aminobutyrate aminotransferase-like enzyme
MTVSVEKQTLHFCSSYHGNISSLVDVSSKSFKRLPQGKKEFVHVIPLPKCQNIEDQTVENGSYFNIFWVIPSIF